MRNIITGIISFGVMLLVGWLFATDDHALGGIIIVIWFFLLGIILPNYGVIYCNVIAVVIGAFITQSIINSDNNDYKNEVLTLAIVSNKKCKQSLAVPNSKYQNNQEYTTTFEANIAYPSFGTTNEEFIYHYYQESKNVLFQNPKHPLSDTMIIAFELSQPQKFKLVKNYPTSKEISEYQKPKVRISEDKILEDEEAMQYINSLNKIKNNLINNTQGE